jgi:uncharacterized membrane protein YdbT with pleckstrin-like domain
MAKVQNNLDDVKFEIKWQGKPHGLLERLLTKLHLNFTDYEISKDELIIKRGFFKQTTNTTELYLLKDPDLTVNIYQRLIGVGTISVLVDTHCGSNKAGQRIVFKNVKECEKVRKLLRDSIEADVMERKITYFDKV